MNDSNNSAPNNLRVLIDGRSVYSPLPSSVFWDAQDLMPEVVERIDVIGGSYGGAAFGAKHRPGAWQTFALGPRQDRRWDHVDDAGPRTQASFHTDRNRVVDSFTVEGNACDGPEGQRALGAIAISSVGLALGEISTPGFNLIARWNCAPVDGGSVELQTYYDRTQRTVPPTFGERLDILDFQLQHSLPPLGIHSLVWGVNARQSRERVDNISPYFTFLPAQVRQQWTSLFAQDEMTQSTHLRLTPGARLERNDYTGTEIRPNPGLAWMATAGHLFWTAVRRAYGRRRGWIAIPMFQACHLISSTAAIRCVRKWRRFTSLDTAGSRHRGCHGSQPYSTTTRTTFAPRKSTPTSPTPFSAA